MYFPFPTAVDHQTTDVQDPRVVTFVKVLTLLLPSGIRATLFHITGKIFLNHHAVGIHNGMIMSKPCRFKISVKIIEP